MRRHAPETGQKDAEAKASCLWLGIDAVLDANDKRRKIVSYKNINARGQKLRMLQLCTVWEAWVDT